MNEPKLWSGDYTYISRVERIIDGDTVVLNVDLGFHMVTRQVFRLSEINAPEPRGETRGAGIAATKNLMDYISKGDKVFIITEKDARGGFGRWSAWIWAEGREEISLNRLMVTDGHAVASP